jgi:hypothetical protein
MASVQDPNFLTFKHAIVPEPNLLKNWNDGISHLEYWSIGIME